MRIRTIKPQYWDDDKVAKLDYFTRLLYIGLWNYVDDNGVGLNDEALIMSKLFSRDFYEKPDEMRMRLHGGLTELSRAGMIETYWDGEHDVLCIPHWKAHQKISRPSPSPYRRPEDVPLDAAKPEEETLFSESSVRTHGGLTEDSVKAHGGLTAGIRNKERGIRNKERGIRKEEEKRDAPASPTPETGSKPATVPDDYPMPFEQWYAIYPWKTGKRDAFGAWRKAIRKTNNATLMEMANRYSKDPSRNPRYTYTPANWLDGEHWEDEPQPKAQPQKPMTRAQQNELAQKAQTLAYAQRAEEALRREQELTGRKELTA